MLENMSETTKTEDLMSPWVEVQRIDHTAGMWFAAALVSVALVIASILVSGWRPSDLSSTGEDVWWIGFSLGAIGLAAIGYAGCPIYWGSVSVAHHQKSIAVRGGLVLFLLGAGVSVIALLQG